MKNPQHLRAILYTRVSTDEQAEHGYSLRAQEEQLQRYCQVKGIEVVEHYQDDGASAKTFRRPAFRQLTERIKAHRGETNLLLVTRWDRFSRDAEGSLMTVAEFQRLGVRVRAIEQEYDEDVPENVLLKMLYWAIPEVENRRRSSNTTAGLRRALKEGRWVNNAPVGYRFIRDSHNKPLLVESDKGALVLKAFEEMAKGVYTAEEVRRSLLREGLNRSKPQFAKMLRNPFYTGRIRIPEYRDEPEEIVQGMHPPLISDELFARVQCVLDGKKRQFGSKTYNKRREEFPLRGYLQCSRCGRTLTGSVIRGRYLYYHCQHGCPERFRVDAAQQHFGEYLQTLNAPSEMVNLYLAIMEDIFREKEGDRAQVLTGVESEIAGVEKRLLAVDEKFVEGDLQWDSYERLKGEYDRQKRALEQRRADILTTDTNYLRYARYGAFLAMRLAESYEAAPLAIKQKLVSLIFPEKLIYANGKYQTPRLNEAIAVFLGKGGGMGSNTERPTTLSDDRSFTVPRTRLELVLPP